MTAKMYISADEREKDLLNPIIQRIHEIYEDRKVKELNLFLTGCAAFNNDSAVTLHWILTHEKPEHLTLATFGYGTMAVPELAIISAGDRRWIRPDAGIRLVAKFPSKYYTGEPSDEEREKGEELQNNPAYHDQERLLDIVNNFIEVKDCVNRLISGRDLSSWGFVSGCGLDRELELLPKSA